MIARIFCSRAFDQAGAVFAGIMLAIAIAALLLPDRVVLALLSWGW